MSSRRDRRPLAPHEYAAGRAELEDWARTVALSPAARPDGWNVAPKAQRAMLTLLARTARTPKAGGWLTDPDVTVAALADGLDMSLRHVRRVLRALEGAGVIRVWQPAVKRVVGQRSGGTPTRWVIGPAAALWITSQTGPGVTQRGPGVRSDGPPVLSECASPLVSVVVPSEAVEATDVETPGVSSASCGACADAATIGAGNHRRPCPVCQPRPPGSA